MDNEDDIVVWVVAAVAAVAVVAAVVSVSVTTVTAMVGVVPGVVFPLLSIIINSNIICQFLPQTLPSVDQSNRGIFGLLTNGEVCQTKFLHCSDVLKFLLSAAPL